VNKLESLFNKERAGRRIKLLHTSDEYTHLKPGDMGTIKFEWFNLDRNTIAVEWDSGSNLSLIEGVDSYAIID
jgi:hypothetical protein